MNNRFLYLSSVCVLIVLAACRSVPDKIEPQLSYAVQDRYLKSLPAPFPPLTAMEKMHDWGKEYLIGLHFANELDLYQAVTAFKRAAILLPEDAKERALEIQYEILLCYYIGNKYSDVTYTFENSPLRTARDDFPALHDLLIILHDSYLQQGNVVQAERIERLIEHYDPASAPKVALSTSLIQGDLPALHHYADTHPDATYVQNFLISYEREKKSPGKAQLLNTFIPGSGYLYIGQKQSAVTSFLLNGLFIAAATHFFQHGNIAAGVIFTSFEAGWYFGGIYGAGLEAKYYNERLYEKSVTPMMNNQGLFPILMLNYAF